MTTRIAILTGISLFLGACSTPPLVNPKSVSDAEITRTEFQKRVPKLGDLFSSAYGYAVFPTIGKGGLLLAHSRGDGVVFERGDPVGSVAIREWTMGPQVGGQGYAQVIFFENKTNLDRFKSNRFEFKAGFSAVAAVKGVALNTSYDDGVAVFTFPRGGLMAEVSAGGQRFTYLPAKKK